MLCIICYPDDKLCLQTTGYLLLSKSSEGWSNSLQLNHMKNSFIGNLAAALCGAVVVGVCQQAAAQELIVNGNFTETNYIASRPGSMPGGQLNQYVIAYGWSNNIYSGSTHGYNFLYVTGTADTTGAYGVAGTVKLWGSNNGGLSTLTAPPGGGNFIAADGVYQQASIQQTVTGLTPGQEYILSFEWAAAQQSGFTGNTTEKWTVSLGNQSYTTATYSNPSHSFSGWMNQSYTFTASSGSEVLSFLAGGTPSGEPPFSLLANVSMEAATPSATPEPTTAEYGVLLLAVPFGVRAFRLFRNKAQA